MRISIDLRASKRAGSSRRANAVLLCVLAISCGAAGAPALFAQPHAERLDRENLLVHRDASGVRAPVKTAADWARRRAEIITGMRQIMGAGPCQQKRCPLDIQIEIESDEGSHVRRLITYAAEPSSRVPAYLSIPKDVLSGQRRAPAVLCLHPTDDVAGHKVVVGLGGKTNRQYAAELAERGYVTLAPAYPLLANYQPDLKRLGYESGTMKAIWDNRRGIDLLESLDCVAPGGVGAIGHSLGGHNAVFTAVMDDRVKVVVSSCGLDAFVDYMDGDITGWTSTRYMPRLAAFKGRPAEIPFDFPELIAALAPRNCLIIAPKGDSNFQWKSVDRIVAAAAPVYALYDAADRLQVLHPDCEHDFPAEMREAAYALFDRVLKQRR